MTNAEYVSRFSYDPEKPRRLPRFLRLSERRFKEQQAGDPGLEFGRGRKRHVERESDLLHCLINHPESTASEIFEATGQGIIGHRFLECFSMRRACGAGG
jgi:hypothetical protein